MNRKMTNLDRKMIEIEMDRLEAILRGEELDGVSLGSNGITEEWVRQAIQDRAALLAGR